MVVLNLGTNLNLIGRPGKGGAINSLAHSSKIQRDPLNTLRGSADTRWKAAAPLLRPNGGRFVLPERFDE
jgi:hypothetical protein